jgi:hypothetical protein
MRKPPLIAENRLGRWARLAAIGALALSTTCAMGLAAVTKPVNAMAAEACRGQVRTYDGGFRRVALVSPARRPVAMVPGLAYDPRTMIPRGTCRAGLTGAI